METVRSISKGLGGFYSLVTFNLVDFGRDRAVTILFNGRKLVKLSLSFTFDSYSSFPVLREYFFRRKQLTLRPFKRLSRFLVLRAKTRKSE